MNPHPCGRSVTYPPTVATVVWHAQSLRWAWQSRANFVQRKHHALRKASERATLFANYIGRATPPLIQFQRWVDDSLAAHIYDWETITVATATRDGAPSARTLFLRGADERGFVFHTNYESRKGTQLAENPRAALVIHWRELERQILIEGTVERISAEESDAYFATRPVQSQLGAWASQQSQPLDSAETLAQRVEQLRTRFAGGPIPRPAHWGGYRVVPNRIEFWQGGPGRLHDRFVYLRVEAGWTRGRLNP